MNRALALQALINDFAAVRRSHYLPGTDERENDIHHSFSVAMLAWFVHDRLELGLDMEKVMKYALVHDLVEVYAGDTNAYADARTREHKKTMEAASLEKIEAEFRTIFPDLTSCIRAYEARSDAEARFVWTIDKMQAMVQGKADAYRPFYEQGLRSTDVRRVHGSHAKEAYPPARAHYEEILEAFLKDFDDGRSDRNGTVAARSTPARKN